MKNLRKLISSGNRKLPKDTAIFNMGSATDCPSAALGLCQARDAKTGKIICYALKAECGLYPNVLPYRRRQEKYWKDVTAEQFAKEFSAINSRKRKPYRALRINESGDFWSQEDITKAEKIAELLSGTVKVYTYTARSDLDFSAVKYLVVNGSGFKKPGISNIFQYVERKEDTPAGYKVCPGNCRICTRCCQKNMLTVVVRH